MKKTILFFLFFTKVLFAQESNDKIIYLDSLERETIAENYFYKKVIKDYSLEKLEYKFFKYYKSGSVYQEGFIDKKESGKLNKEILTYFKNGNKEDSTFFIDGKPFGKVEKWYENGNKREVGEFTIEEWETGKSYKIVQFWDENNNQLVVDGNGFYNNSVKKSKDSGAIKNGYKNGVWTGESSLNQVSYVESYDEGKFISGVTTDKEGNKISYLIVEQKPEPKKGFTHFYKFIGSNFNYTNESIQLKIKGKILIEFVIDVTGKIVEPKIIKGLGYGLDQEAIRVLLKYENWISGKQRGLNVRVRYTIPITLQGY